MGILQQCFTCIFHHDPAIFNDVATIRNSERTAASRPNRRMGAGDGGFINIMMAQKPC
jgi:hypothetical protein